MDDDDDEDDEDEDDDDEDVNIVGGVALPIGGNGNGATSLGFSTANTGLLGVVGSVMANNNNNKALCSGKDMQTAECRGELCQIGKDGKCITKMYASAWAVDRQTASKSTGTDCDAVFSKLLLEIVDFGCSILNTGRLL